MVLCNVECVRKISNYLNLPAPKTRISENNIIAVDNLIKNQSLEGFATIIRALSWSSKHSHDLEEDEITRALSYQWLEYIALYVNYADDSANGKKIFKELNEALKSNAYLAGPMKTIADVAMYYSLHSIMNNLTNQEKAEFVHVSRWYDNIQQDEKIRQTLDLINFNATSLYLLRI